MRKITLPPVPEEYMEVHCPQCHTKFFLPMAIFNSGRYRCPRVPCSQEQHYTDRSQECNSLELGPVHQLPPRDSKGKFIKAGELD